MACCVGLELICEVVWNLLSIGGIWLILIAKGVPFELNELSQAATPVLSLHY